MSDNPALKKYKSTIWARGHESTGSFWMSTMEEWADSEDSFKEIMRGRYEVHAFCNIEEVKS